MEITCCLHECLPCMFQDMLVKCGKWWSFWRRSEEGWDWLSPAVVMTACVVLDFFFFFLGHEGTQAYRREKQAMEDNLDSVDLQNDK